MTVTKVTSDTLFTELLNSKTYDFVLVDFYANYYILYPLYSKIDF